jgi:DNA-directed RNA polymerase specialized sigma24 family protein
MTETQEQSIELLFKNALQGDKDSLNEFCEVVREGLVQITTFRLRGWSQDSIEDIVHETLTTFIEKISHVRGSPTAFLRGILYNKIGNELRRSLSQRKNVALEASPLEHEHHNGFGHQQLVNQVENRDLISLCANAILKMKEPCRTLMIGILEGRSVGEVWIKYSQVETQLTRHAFDRRLFLCRRRLIKALGGIK